MRYLALLAAAALIVAPGPDTAASSGKIYRWVDENGVVHFGDAIPPEYSRERHEIVDPRGVRITVDQEPAGPPTPVRSDRDRALLATYGTMKEIEELRDRRTGYLQSQNEVALDRLRALRTRQRELEGNAHSVNELLTVKQRIGEYEAEISRRDAEIQRIRAEFDGDIRRFVELKGESLPENR